MGKDKLQAGNKAKPHLTQRIFNESMEQHPELQAHAQTIADIITQAASETHLATASLLTENLTESMSTYYKNMRKRKPTKKMIETIKKNPSKALEKAISTVHDQSIIAIQQFIDVISKDLNDDDGAVIGDC